MTIPAPPFQPPDLDAPVEAAGDAGRAVRAETVPLVVQIRRGSEHDGPGLRSVVFFKGCHLRCTFCQNPETQSPQRELAFQPSSCLQCGACEAACPNRAIQRQQVDGHPARIDRVQCQRCGACATECPSGALQMLGAQYGPEQLSKLLLRDLAYYRHSGGGVTLSGGECLIFPDYLLELLDALETSGIHVAVQTGGEFHYASAASVLERVALIQFDLKFANPELYRAHAGHGSVHVIDNLRRLLEHAAHKVEVRIPLIPEITTTDTNLRELAQLLQQLAVPKVTLLPFNPLGRNTLHALGRRVVAVSNQSLDPQAHAALISRFRTALSPCKCD